MNKKINELIPKAMEAIRDSKMANEADEVKKEYKGYISSMGASILQSGLIATLAFYSKNADDSGAKRTNLLDAIFRIIEHTENNRNNRTLLKYVIEQTRINPNGNTIRVSGLDKIKLKKLERKISDALIALKLALRTYKIKN